MNSSEILFLYDALRTNPNGDMDQENKPRMDYDSSTNLVSDLRLKRYVRDYLVATNDAVELFVTAEAEDAEERVQQLLDREPSSSNPVTDEELTEITSKCIDAKLFGAVLGTPGGNSHVHGPVQFNWGYSLNKVDIQESRTTTSSFSGGRGIGKDYRVKYSFLAFNGGINGYIADQTELTDDDLELFDEAMVKSIPFGRSRSKIGQTPRFYMRVVLNDSVTNLKDLREGISLAETEGLESIDDVELQTDELNEFLASQENLIEKILIWKDDKLDDIEINPDGITVEPLSL